MGPPIGVSMILTLDDRGGKNWRNSYIIIKYRSSHAFFLRLLLNRFRDFSLGKTPRIDSRNADRRIATREKSVNTFAIDNHTIVIDDEYLT